MNSQCWDLLVLRWSPLLNWSCTPFHDWNYFWDEKSLLYIRKVYFEGTGVDSNTAFPNKYYCMATCIYVQDLWSQLKRNIQRYVKSKWENFTGVYSAIGVPDGTENISFWNYTLQPFKRFLPRGMKLSLILIGYRLLNQHRTLNLRNQLEHFSNSP